MEKQVFDERKKFEIVLNIVIVVVKTEAGSFDQTQ